MWVILFYVNVLQSEYITVAGLYCMCYVISSTSCTLVSVSPHRCIVFDTLCYVSSSKSCSPNYITFVAAYIIRAEVYYVNTAL